MQRLQEYREAGAQLEEQLSRSRTEIAEASAAIAARDLQGHALRGSSPLTARMGLVCSIMQKDSTEDYMSNTSVTPSSSPPSGKRNATI